MPIAKALRRSPGYLYAKMYCLALSVSLFAARPISRRLAPGQLAQLQRLHSLVPHLQLPSHLIPRGSHALMTPSSRSTAAPLKVKTLEVFEPHVNGRGPGKAAKRAPSFSWALKSLAHDAPSFTLPSPQGLAERMQRSLNLLHELPRRWFVRVKDLAQVRQRMRLDENEARRCPELERDAAVRVGSNMHPQEMAFVQQRRAVIAESAELARLLGLPAGTEVHPEDVPLVALCGSGGGYRAKFGFTAALEVLKREGIWSVATWTAGVSGSCWSIAALYTVANLCPTALMAHYVTVAHEGLHPLSRGALDVVARSKHGTYFLLAPLLAKARSGVVGLGLMDLYATMTTCYQFLSRSPHARPRLSRSTFSWAQVFERTGIAAGQAPLPILTAVRRDHSVGTPPYQWWEATPLEVGSPEAGKWVPTWSFGRTFRNGASTQRIPETSLALLLGYCTSAPAGPLTGYVSALIASLPVDTWASIALGKLNAFIQHRRFERRWGNLIRAADEPNPLVGDEDAGWERKRRLKLMDAGLANNLPSHIFTSTSRQADILLAFDYSSDVQSNAAFARLSTFGQQRGLTLVPRQRLEPFAAPDPLSPDEDCSIETRFAGRYAQIIDVWRAQSPDKAGVQYERPVGEPHMCIVYCPLLPHRSQRSFDPSRSSFSNSYNLVWQPNQVEQLARTSRACVEEYVAPALRTVLRDAWARKLAQREREGGTMTRVR